MSSEGLESESLRVVKVSRAWIRESKTSCALFVFAAGFEERALKVFRETAKAPVLSPFVVLRYLGGMEANDIAFASVEKISSGRNREYRSVPIDVRQPGDLEEVLRQCLLEMDLAGAGEIWLDISGLPLWGIAVCLRELRSRFPRRRVVVLYTEAKEYFPTKSEYQGSAVKKKADRLQIQLPDSLTSEMAENLILESFAGVALHQHSTILLLFAGYEKHRSIGVIEQVNPSKLVLVYGKPGLRSLAWRLELSRNLHAALVTDRPTAEETISTTEPSEAIRMVEEYYSVLYDDHNFVVAPVCSKMQAVGCFLAWERFRDIQLVFPLPVRYLPDRFSRGVGRSFRLELPPLPGLSTLLEYPAASEANARDGSARSRERGKEYEGK